MVCIIYLTKIKFNSILLYQISFEIPTDEDLSDSSEYSDRESSLKKDNEIVEDIDEGKNEPTRQDFCNDSPMGVGLPQHRASCHRCGNIRRKNLYCSHCPYIYCARCSQKMLEEHGHDIFIDGCPVVSKLK